MSETLHLPQEFIDEMVAHARADLPNECCGVVLRFRDGRLKLLRATNVEASPYRFSIPPGERLHLFKVIDDQEADLFVIYHSHTMTEARPSPTDANLSRMLEGPPPVRAWEMPGSWSPPWREIRRHIWPYWVVVSLAGEPPSVRAWELHDGEATELSLHAGSLPAGSTRAQLVSDGDARKPRVREVPLPA